ncbi:uncharacterized protein C4orf36 homolog [Tiliqua scincoides]|uniref:uncharacterized protein C4orf36 homolog n=1 Tax=Tiliqua scincoides TaxID=71010 RepID=UPI003461A83C
MEYNLHKKRKLTFVLKTSDYKVHDRAEFALLTARLLKAAQEPVANPLHHDIYWCYPFKLRPVTTNVKVQVPSLQAIELEKILERQRFEKIEYQNKVAQQTESEFRSRRFLARRPLPPSGLK